jgi:8-oxo-dGTP diphosphatase
MANFVTTGQAARAIGVSISALQSWAKDRIVQPALTTPGGRYRWDVNDLLRQLGGRPATPRPTSDSGPPPLPPVVLAVITAREGVAIGKRAEPPPPWSFIGGAEIEDGETAEQTAVRTAREDAQIAVRAGTNLGHRVHPVTGRLVTYVACVPATKGDHPITPGDEHRFTEVKWAGLAEATELMPDMDPRALAHLQRVMRRR